MSQVLVERRGSTAWVTFNRPEAHNAMTFAMYELLYDCLLYTSPSPRDRS